MLNQGYGKIINTASMASLIGEWWELTVVLQNPYFNYYRCYLNQLNLYWEGVNHWHFVLEEMYYKIFIDTIFQHLSVLYVLEHLLLFIEEAESSPLIWCTGGTGEVLVHSPGISGKRVWVRQAVPPRCLQATRKLLRCFLPRYPRVLFHYRCQQVSPPTLLNQQCRQKRQ